MIADVQPDLMTRFLAVESKLDRVLNLLAAPPEPRRWYTVKEFAALVKKAEFTVMQWCNNGRINAAKGAERRGKTRLWRIPVSELARFSDDGLLPFDRSRNAPE